MKGPIAWFARNTVAANLLMVFIVAIGLLSMNRLVLEVFPEFSAQVITINVPYLGAAPEEVEEGVCLRIEEAIQDIEGIKKIRSTAAEGMGTVLVELEDGRDEREALDEIKARVDAIATFPEETEKPIIQEIVVRSQVINVAISGDTDEASLKRIGERVRDDLAAKPEITQVVLTASRAYEISIEISEAALRRWGLTFDDVVNAVRRSSLDLPGGSVRTDAGEILLRTKGQAYRGREFEDLVLLARADGTRLHLGDVATVVDGFAETDQAARFDGRPAVVIQVFRVGHQSALEIAGLVKEYVAEVGPSLPDGIEVTTWQDDTSVLRSRLNTLIRNGRAGLILVFLVLALFLKLRLAGWVSAGIAVSFLGAIALMPLFDVSINVISLFAFVMVLGIVVDDAIVVGENIYRYHERGKDGVAAAIAGAREVAIPVTFSILTSIAAFSPLLMVDGAVGTIMRILPMVVIFCLVISLIESLFILPAHLSHIKRTSDLLPARGFRRIWRRVQSTFASGLKTLIERLYRPALERALEWRYLTVSVALSLVLFTTGLVGGGWVKFVFMPTVEAENAVALLTMPQGTPADVTSSAIRRLEDSALELQRRFAEEGEPEAFRHIMTTVGEQPFLVRQARGGGRPGLGATVSSANVGEVNIELAPAESRRVDSEEVVRRWRDLAGQIPDAVELTYSSSLFSVGEAINVQLAARDLDHLQAAAAAVKDQLRRYPGVFDVADSFRPGKQEIKLDITPGAEALGLSLSDLARQVRHGFYGAEAQRIQRGRDDIRVMVRYPAVERRTLASLEDMRIRTPAGGEIPFSFAGRAALGRGYASIRRTDRRRTVSITADVDDEVASANQIIRDLDREVLPTLLADYPGVSHSFEGEQQEQRETLAGLGRGMLLALIVIYGLLAIPFRSYLQPLIIMSAIPFGLIGAVWGHVLMGMDMTILSAFGIVALTGVVVNDSLVLVDFINRSRRAGTPLDEALREAGAGRFRPILLTSLTTFAGLTPLLLERSLQAQFLIPMAASLAFGVLFATFITLILVPVLYRILEDFRHRPPRAMEADELAA